MNTQPQPPGAPPISPGLEQAEVQRRLAQFRRIAALLLVVAGVAIAFYLILYALSGVWQIGAEAGIIVVGVACLGAAYPLAQRGRLDAAGTLIMLGLAIAYGGPELVWVNATTYLAVGGMFVILFAGNALLPQNWRAWLLVTLLFVGYVWLAGGLAPFPRYDIEQSLALRIFIPLITAALGLLFMWQIIALLQVGTLRARLISVILGVTMAAVSAVAYLTDRAISPALTTAVNNQLENLAQSQALAVAVLLDKQVALLQSLGLNPTLSSAAAQASATANGDLAALTQLDQEWQAADAANSNADPLVQSVLSNPLAAELRQFRQSFPDHVEIFVTDKYGANLAATNRTSDYYQADEEWWQTAYNNGQGAIYIGPPAYDQSSQTSALNMAIPLYQPGGHEIIGILRTTYRVDAIIQVLASAQIGRTGRADLLLPDGQRLHSGSAEPEQLDPQSLAKIQAIGAGVGEITLDGTPLLVDRAPVASSPMAPTPIISNLGWWVLAHQDQAESLAPIRAQQRNILLLIVLVAGLTASLAVGGAQLLADPIIRLTSVAEKIGAGDLTLQAPLEAADEIRTLARSFNTMTARLRDTIGSLETRVNERTAELAQASERMRSRAAQLQANAEIARAVASNLDLQQLLPLVAQLISERFGFYHVGIFLLDARSEYAVLQAANSEGGQHMLARGHRLRVGAEGIVGHVTGTGQPRTAQAVGQDAVYFNNPDLPLTRSEITLPLKVGERVIGALDVQSTQEAAFSDEDLSLLSALADQMAIAIENARSFERMAKQADVNRRLFEEATQSSERQRALAEENRGLLERAQTAVEELNALTRRLTGEGWQAFRTGQPEQFVAEASAPSAAVESQAGAQPDNRNAIIRPVTLRGEVIGTVRLEDADASRAWTDLDVKLLEGLTERLALTLDNARLFDEAQQRLNELGTINVISQALATELDLQTMAEVVGERILEAFGVTIGYIALYDPRTGLIETPFYQEGGQRLYLEPLPLGRSLASEIIRSKKPLLLNHDAERQAEAMGAVFTGRPAKSYLGVPILLADEALGVISVQSDEQEGLFNENDVRLMSTIAGSLGVAIQNARLFTETQRRAQQLATASEVSRAANSLLDPDQLLVQAIELMRERFELYYAAVFLVDGSGQWAVLKHATGEAGRILLERQHRLEVGGQSMVGTAISLRVARVALDVGTEPVRFANPLLPDTRSEMALPLALGQTVLGALDVQSTRPGAFSQSDIAVLQTMADQLATTLQNARLFEATQRELAERKRAEQELIKVQLGLERATEAVFITDTDGKIIYANPAFETVYGWKPEEALGQTPRIIKSGLVPQDQYQNFWGTLLSKQVVAGEIINKRKDGRLIPIEASNNPILDADGNLIGFLGMHRDISERKRTEDELQRRAQQLSATAEIGRAATSTLDLDTLLRDSVELIRNQFGYYHASVFLIEPGTDLAVVRESTGEAGRQLKARRHALAVGSQSLVGQATAQRQPVVVQDVSREPTHFKNPLLPDTRAEAVVPMRAGDAMVGALDVQSTSANAFSESDLATLTTIADQLAVAVQNARLFERTSRQARREQLVVEITNKIRAAPDVDAMLRTAVTELRQALGVSQGMVRLSPTVKQPAPAPAPDNGHDPSRGGNGASDAHHGSGNGSGNPPL